MTKTLEFAAGASRTVVHLSSTDQRILSVALKGEIGTGPLLQQIFLWSDRHRLRSCSRAVLISAIDELLTSLHRDWDLLSKKYVHSCVGRGGAGGTGGIRLPDDDHFYTLFSDVATCRLLKMSVDENQQGRLVEEIDCRRLRSLETLNMGTISIAAKKAKSSLLESLERLKADLETSNNDEVVIT